jgi:hypothetical protein
MQEAERGDEQILVAVAIEVHDLGVRGRAHRRERLLGERPRGRLPDPRHEVAVRVAHDDVRQPVAVEVGDGDVRHHGALFALRPQADRPAGRAAPHRSARMRGP